MSTPAAPEHEPRGRGRPRASSRAVLEEAAFELFLEQGYDGTTAADIARRAGVSRGTFFNYFAAKADVFWADIDEALALLPESLHRTDAVLPAEAAVRAGLLDLAREFGPDRVPWILTQFEAIGSPAEVGVSVLARASLAIDAVAQFVAERDGISARALHARVVAYSALGVVLAAAQTWAEAGPARGSLAPHLERAFGESAIR